MSTSHANPYKNISYQDAGAYPVPYMILETEEDEKEKKQNVSLARFDLRFVELLGL